MYVFMMYVRAYECVCLYSRKYVIFIQVLSYIHLFNLITRIVIIIKLRVDKNT